MDAKLAVSFHNRWIVGADDVVNAGIGGNRITSPDAVRSEDRVRGRSLSAGSPRTRRPVTLGARDGHLAGRHQRPVVRAGADTVIAGIKVTCAATLKGRPRSSTV
jgi:hypothetical protein